MTLRILLLDATGDKSLFLSCWSVVWSTLGSPCFMFWFRPPPLMEEEKKRGGKKKSNWEFSENLLRFFLAFYFSKFFFLSCGLNQKQPQMKWVYFYDYTMMNHSRIVYSRNKDKKKKVFPPLQLLNQFMWFWFSKGEGTWGRGGGGVALPQTDNYMNLPPILGRCHLCLSSTPPPPRIQGCRWSLCGGGGAGC